MMIKKYYISLLLLTFSGLLFSQKTQFYLDKDANYKTGLELFDKQLKVNQTLLSSNFYLMIVIIKLRTI